MFFMNAPKPTPQFQPYTEANKVMAQIRKAFYTIKNQYKPEEAEKATAQLLKEFGAQVKYWEEEKAAAEKAIQEKLNTAKPTNVRTLTAEDVAVLSYKANVLKGRFMQAKSSADFEALKLEILGSEDEQLKQAFLDHFHEYSELQVQDSGALRRLLSDTQKGLTDAFLTDEEKAYKALQDEAENERTVLNSKFYALELNLKDLHVELNKGKWGGQKSGTEEVTAFQESEESLWS